MHTKWLGCYPLILLVLVTALHALAPTTGLAAERKALRVCADPNNLPFSHQNRQGFENQLAELLAADLGVPVEYTWFPQRMGFIRNTLRASDPAHGGHKCDIVMGVPHGFELAITTKPYYRSTYALVYVKGRALDDLRTGKDLLNLDNPRKQKLRIGLFARTPAAAWLAKHGMLEQMVAFPTMSGDPAAYPGELVEKELVSGRIDAAIVWGPIAGYFTKHAQNTELEMIPLPSEPEVRFHYAISAGVRFGEGDWKNEVDALLQRNAGKIEALLREYNVPLVDKDGFLLATGQ